VKLVEPISRMLLRPGKLYLSLFVKNTGHLDIKRYPYILSLITYHDRQLTQKALAQMLGKDKSAMVSVLDNLTDKGYITREVNPADRREHLIKATPKAHKAVPEIVAEFQKINQQITEDISDEELQVFETVLQKMHNKLKILMLQHEPNQKQNPEHI